MPETARRHATGQLLPGASSSVESHKILPSGKRAKSHNNLSSVHSLHTAPGDLRRSVTAEGPSKKRVTVLAARDGAESATDAVERMARQRQELRRRIVAMIARAGEAYVVEVAAAVGERWTRVSGQLRQLEKAGVLVSRFESVGERGCTSGLGRRYFRLASKDGGGNG